jgi:hypothetical protein
MSPRSTRCISSQRFHYLPLNGSESLCSAPSGLRQQIYPLLKTVWIAILALKRVMSKFHLRNGNRGLVALTQTKIKYFIQLVGTIISSIGDDDQKN